MNTKKILLSTAVLYLGYTNNAQQSQFSRDKENYKYNLAEGLYQTKIYNAAQYEYAQQYFYNQSLSQSRKEAAQFFDNVIGVILQKSYAEKGLEAFMKEYPNSSFFAQANLPLADYYLAQKDFEKALETLQKVNQYQLSLDENRQYILKLGYARFMTGDAQGAIEALQEAYTALPQEERGDVSYMLGHLYYADGQNAKAFEYFDAVKNDEEYAQMVRPYYVQLYFNEKDYDKAIQEGTELLNYNISSDYKAEVHKIIGESYFMKKDYSAAYPHLKSYLETQSNPSESDLYEMGFVSSQLRNYDDAVFYFSQLINSTTPMSQNAYYQLGNAYLQTGKKKEALSAFRSAYQMTFDAKVKQLAHEQYAKLSYDIGNPFESASNVIQKYIDNYPKSAKVPEMRSILVKSYLYSGNYKETLDAIDRLPEATKEVSKIEQEVSFLLGTEEFNKGNYTEAQKYFERSLEVNENKEFTPRAQYWLGQTSYQLGNYSSAIHQYEKLANQSFPEKQQLPYDLGYAHFKAKNFSKANTYFKEYLTNPKEEFKSDAELRLADTYYADNNLNEAIAIYDKNNSSDDYTLYQKAMALGFKGDTEAKIKNLKNLISQNPSSEYVDDAQYEIGSAYAAQEDPTNSNEYFTKVIQSSKDRDLVANAQIYRAQNYIDLKQEAKALTELKSLANQYKNTAYASKIVQAARPIYIAKGDLTGYQDLAREAGVRLDTSEISEINLTSAKNFYVKKDYKNAITNYEKYLAQNPTGEGLYQAQYELGESYYQTKNTAKALTSLILVANSQNDYQEDAQTRVAQIYIAQDNTVEAKKYLTGLANSSNVNIKNYVNVELMKIYAEEGDFTNAEKFAENVISNTKNSAAVLEGAKVIKARSLMNNGKDKEAQAAYVLLEKSGNTEVAAEALYAKAWYQYKAKAYKTSNETIFKLANNYASEEYWGAKALLVMARNYLALKDKYQASYTVDELIANYQDFPEIVAEAKDIKKQIK